MTLVISEKPATDFHDLSEIEAEIGRAEATVLSRQIKFGEGKVPYYKVVDAETRLKCLHNWRLKLVEDQARKAN